jgi:SAM-dependent methyltransferase
MSLIQAALDGESLITPELLSRHSGANEPSIDDRELTTARDQLALALNIIRQRFDATSNPATIIGDLVAQLHVIRSRYDGPIWKALVPLAQRHPVADYVHQDPFTQWSFDKPRGYSGDAHLLDFIYEHADVRAAIEASTPLGQTIYGYTKESGSPVAVRERRDILARHVDRIAAAHGPGTEVLTIAAGHLREAAVSRAFSDGSVSRWVALDQDPVSVDGIRRTYAATAVEPLEGSVKGFLTDAYQLGRFDFAYSAGLYDYLPQAVAIKVTRKAMQVLKPGGTYLFANFTREIVDDGYMETFMNWELLLRSEAEMWDIINNSVDRNAVEASVEFGANRAIVYGIIRLKA